MWLEGDSERGVWGVLWRENSRLDGEVECLQWNYGATPLLFRTRRKAQEYINEKYGYIRERPDLRAEPHGWKMPIPVKVKVTWEIEDGKD